MANTSATGGYLVPTSSEPIPGGLTLTQFIQTVIVGITGYAGALVRPRWQVAPPKQPDITINWIAFGITAMRQDQFAYVAMNEDEVTQQQRQDQFDVQCAFYGPNALENMMAFQDGFQIQQNLENLSIAKMGYVGISPIIRGPDLINERWVERFETTVTFTREVLRVYPILSFASAEGIIHTVVDNNDLNIDWQTPLPED